MAFPDRGYEVFALLGSTKAPPPWVSSSWNQISGPLFTLLDAVEGNSAIRSSQLGGDPPSMRPIPFGRLSTSTRSTSKWIHKEDELLTSGQKAHFQDCEIWTPSWTVCERRGMPPDIYFCMANERLGPSSEGYALKHGFSSKCILAAAQDLETTVLSDASEVIKKLEETLISTVKGKSQRSWGRRYVGSSSFDDAINDLAINGLLNHGYRDQSSVTLRTFKGDWTPF